MPNRTVCAGLAAAFVTLAACGDSTTPHGVSPAQLARHIDSLSVAADTGVTGPIRSQILEELEVAPALGAAPVPVQVTTPSGQQTWEGFAYKTANLGGLIDSVYYLVAYNDYALDVVLLAEQVYGRNPTSLSVFLMDSGAIMLGGQGTLAATTTSTGGGCILAAGLKNSIGPLASDCNLATVQANFTYTFTPGPATISAYATITIPSQSFNGVVVQ